MYVETLLCGVTPVFTTIIISSLGSSHWPEPGRPAENIWWIVNDFLQGIVRKSDKLLL